MPIFESTTNKKHLLVTIPKSTKWGDYEEELKLAEQGYDLNFKVNHLPKQTGVGCRCYLLYDGSILGWMGISGLKQNEEFVCETTGISWTGNFVKRSGAFNKINPHPMKGFQGYRYVTEELLEILLSLE